jgi:hypothetical protein
MWKPIVFLNWLLPRKLKILFENHLKSDIYNNNSVQDLETIYKNFKRLENQEIEVQCELNIPIDWKIGSNTSKIELIQV